MVHYTPEMLVDQPWREESPLYTDGVSYQAYYSEVGKAHYMGKDLTEVRSLQRKLVPGKVGLEEHEQTSLQGIAIKAKAKVKHRFRDLYRCLNAQCRFLCFCTIYMGVADASGFAAG